MKRRHPTHEDRARAAQMIRDHATYAEVAAAFGRSKAWVRDIVRANGLTAQKERTGRRPGPRRGHIPEIIRRLLAGETQRGISRALGFGVHSLIREVRIGKIDAPELFAVVGPARPCMRRTGPRYRY